MNQKLTFKSRLFFTGILTLIIWTFLAWDYFHEGVPTHHILHRQDLPGISNWWGGIVLPLLIWFLLHLIQTSMNQNEKSNIKFKPIHFVYRFCGALLFATSLSIFFTIGSNLPIYMMLAIIILSFFVPLFQPEYLLGFVLGMTYTFGTMLPILIGSILTLIFLISNKLMRYGILHIVSKLKPNRLEGKNPK